MARGWARRQRGGVASECSPRHPAGGRVERDRGSRRLRVAFRSSLPEFYRPTLERMRRGVTGWRAIRTLALGFVPGLCPRCLAHSMFRSFWELYERCPNCNVQYAKESGAWLGALAIGYTLGAAFAMVLGIIEW